MLTGTLKIQRSGPLKMNYTPIIEQIVMNPK